MSIAARESASAPTANGWRPPGAGCACGRSGSWREGPQIGGGAFAFSPDGTLLAVDTGHGAVRLVDPDTGREYARLENPNQDRAFFLSFSPDGTQLVITGGDNQPLHVWDLRAIRKQLAKMGLDWALPPYSPARRSTKRSRSGSRSSSAIRLNCCGTGKRQRGRSSSRNVAPLEANPNDARRATISPGLI